VDASSAKPASNYPAGSPIPSGPDAPSAKDLHVIYEAWANRVIVDEFRRSNPDSANISAFLTDATHYLWQAREETRKALSVRAKELERTGSTDPAFQLMSGAVDSDPKAKEKLLRQAITGFPKTKYSRFLLFIAAASLGKSLDDRKASAAEVTDADRIALENLRASLNAESFRAEEMPALRWRLCSQSAESLVRRRGSEIAEVFEKATNIPDWLRELGQGRGYLQAAWTARTSDWAHEVTEAGWAGWRENLAKGREHFTKSWD
jgi:hypothetical protein